MTRFEILEYFGRLRYYSNSPWSDLNAPCASEVTGLSSLARKLVPKALRPRVKTMATAAVRTHSRIYAARLGASGQAIKLHLGCGPTHLPGWVNVDLIGAGADLAWDLRIPLPFPEGSIAAVFHEHLLEHLEWWEAVSFLRECHRVLRSGGILRIGVPDFRRFARDYASGGEALARIRPGRPTPLLAFAELIFCYEHRSVWDEETLCQLLHELGYTAAQRHDFRDSRLEPMPDSRHRQPESLYIEALKPTGVASPVVTD